MEKIDEIECPKCHKKIVSSNKKLHDVQCTGVPQQTYLPGDTNQFYDINRIEQNMNGNTAVPLVSPIGSNGISSNNNNNNNENNDEDDISDLFYCNVCDNYMPKVEREDHMYSHQMETQNNGNQSNVNFTSNIDSNLSRTNSIGSGVSDDMNMRSSNLSGSHGSFDNPHEFTSFNNYRFNQNRIPIPNQNLNVNQQQQNPNNDPNTTVTNLPNGRVKTVTYDPNTGMIREVETGEGFESITTYPRNNPNMRSMTTRSTNNNNFVQFSGSPPNRNVMFPPGFPFHNVPGGTSANYGMGMGFPFGGTQVNFESDNNNNRSRRSHRNRNDLGQIFGLQNFDGWMQNILSGIDLGHFQSHHADYTQLIDELPEMTVDEKSKIPQDKSECMICMSNFQMKEKVKIMPCTHFFHTDCIREWFKANDTCPICKYSVSEEGNQDSEGH